MTDSHVRAANVSGDTTVLPLIAELMDRCAVLNEYREEYRGSSTRGISLHGSIELCIPITVDGEMEHWSIYLGYWTNHRQSLKFERTTRTVGLGAQHFVTATFQNSQWTFKQELELRPK